MFKKKVLSLIFSLILMASTLTPSIISAEDSGVIKITVTDNSGNSLSGYDFAIRDASGSRVSVDGSYGVYSYNGPYEVISSNGGIIQIHGIPAGTYSIQYIGTDNTLSFNDGYFTVRGGETSFMDMVGIKQAGSVRIKLSGSGGEALSGIHFHITKNGSTVGFVNLGSSYEESNMGGSTITTDSSGNILISSLSPGNYIIYQDNMASGYNSTPVQESFYVSVGQTSNLTFTNSKIYSSLKISSVDENNGKVPMVVNVKKDGSLISAFTDGAGSFEYSANAGVEDFNVSEPITISGLPYGNYTVTVKSIDDSYSKPADVQVSLDSSQGKAITLKSEQKGTKLTIRISDSEGSVSGFPVEILSGSDKLKFKEVSSGVYEYSTASSGPTELSTSSNGSLVVTGIPDGTVKVKTKSADGYKKSTQEKSVKLKTGSPETVEIEVERADKKTIVLSTNSPLPFSGATLKVLDSSGSEVFSQELTDENSIDISSLSDGSYKYALTNLPDGYLNKEYTGNFKIANGELPNSPTINMEPMNLKVKVPAEIKDVSLFDNEGNEVQAVVQNQVAEFPNVLDGKYIVKVGDEERIVDVNRTLSDNNVSFVEDETEPTGDEPQLGPGTQGDIEDKGFLDLLLKYWWIILIPLIGLACLLLLLFAKKKKYKTTKIEESAEAAIEANNNIDDVMAAMVINDSPSQTKEENDQVVSVAADLPLIEEEDEEVSDDVLKNNVEEMVASVDEEVKDDPEVTIDDLLLLDSDSDNQIHHQDYSELLTEEEKADIISSVESKSLDLDQDTEPEITLSNSDIELTSEDELPSVQEVSDDVLEPSEISAIIIDSSANNKGLIVEKKDVDGAQEIEEILKTNLPKIENTLSKDTEILESDELSTESVDLIEDSQNIVEESQNESIIDSIKEDISDKLESVSEKTEDIKEALDDKVDVISDAVSEVKEDIKDVMNSAKEEVVEAKSSAASYLAEQLDKVRGALTEARDDAEDVVDNAKDKVKKVKKSVSDTLQEQLSKAAEIMENTD